MAPKICQQPIKLSNKPGVKRSKVAGRNNKGQQALDAEDHQQPAAVPVLAVRLYSATCPRCLRSHQDKSKRGDLCTRCVARKEEESRGHRVSRTYQNDDDDDHTTSPKQKSHALAARGSPWLSPPGRQAWAGRTPFGTGLFWFDGAGTSTKVSKACRTATAASRGAKRRRRGEHLVALHDDPVLDGVALAADQATSLPSDRHVPSDKPAGVAGRFFATGERYVDVEAALTMDDIRHEEPTFAVRTVARRRRGRKGRKRQHVDGVEVGGRGVVLCGGGCGGDGWEDDYELVAESDDEDIGDVIALENWEELD